MSCGWHNSHCIVIWDEIGDVTYWSPVSRVDGICSGCIRHTRAHTRIRPTRGYLIVRHLREGNEQLTLPCCDDVARRSIDGQVINKVWGKSDPTRAGFRICRPVGSTYGVGAYCLGQPNLYFKMLFGDIGHFGRGSLCWAFCRITCNPHPPPTTILPNLCHWESRVILTQLIFEHHYISLVTRLGWSLKSVCTMVGVIFLSTQAGHNLSTVEE